MLADPAAVKGRTLEADSKLATLIDLIIIFVM